MCECIWGVCLFIFRNFRLKNYLGMQVERDLDHRWLKLHQEKFIKELGEKYGIENERKVATPLPAEFKLVKAAEDEGVEAEEQQQFQSLVGCLLYAAVHTRPDISFSVGQLARVVQNPSEEQVDAAERVVKYLNSHPSIGVQYSASAQVKQKGVEVLKEKGELLGEGKLPSDPALQEDRDERASAGYYLMSQSLELNQRHHVMHLLPEVDCGPKALTVLKELHAPTSVVATLMLERELSALRLSKRKPVQPVLDKMRDLYAKLATAGITYPEQTKCLKMLSLLPESWLQFTSGLSLPQNQSLWTLEWVRTKILEEDFRRRQLRGGDDGSSGYGMQGCGRGRGRGFGGAGRGAKKDDDSNDQQGGTGWGRGAKSGRGGKSGAGGKMKGSCWYCEKEGHPWFLCYKKPDGWTPQNRHQDGGARRNQKNGANMVADSSDNNPRSNGGAEKKKERTAGQSFHIGEQGEQGDASAKLLDDVRAAPINEVCSASGHALKVAGAGRAAFKGVDGKPVVLHDVLLVPDLKANLISLRKLAKAGVSTSTDGARTYKGQLGNRVLWDLHESKDVYRSMWKLPALAWHGGGQAGEGSASQGECNAVGGVGVKVSARSGETDWATAHRRLGHRWLGRKTPVDMLRVFNCMAVAHVPKKYRSKLGASAIWCVHLGLAAESKGRLLWEPSKGVLFKSRDVKFVEGMMYGGWKKQPETKVSQQMEQITMQLDLTPSVWEEGEEAAAEGGDGEKVQEAPAGGGDDVENSSSTKEAAGSDGGEQQQGSCATIKEEAKGCRYEGADVAEQQLGNEEVLLILPHGYDPDEEDEPAYCFLAPAPEEPASMEEALAGPDSEKWLVSRDAEYQSLLENGTWDLVVLAEGKIAVQYKCVLRIKTDDKGQVTIYKSRLVAKGFMQKEKQDFNEIFAPTAKPPTLRVLLADAAVSGKFIIQMDISTAFLNGILEEDVYMTEPSGYEDGTGRVCKLKKSIYGLKQAIRCWYQKLTAVLEEMGFRTSSCDESLFLKGEGEKLVLFSRNVHFGTTLYAL
ncbi:unnamed protein product [Closterium sp. NIES-53]